MKRALLLILVLIFAYSACASAKIHAKGVKKMEMTITSLAFQNNGTIPEKYSGYGENLIPPLKFSNVPPKAKSLALIVEDPDAPYGTFTHWVLFNIDPGSKGIGEGASPKASLTGKNSAGGNAYMGPRPPSGKPHRYFFKLYALDIVLQLGKDAGKSDVEKAMAGHIISEAKTVGIYKR